MTTKRKDNKGRVLNDGEFQRKDGRYEYRYTDETGKQVEEKVYPSYVLVKMVMTDETWHVVRNISGVTGFVGPASKPVPLSDREVAALGVEAKKSAVVEVSFKEGDSVTVTAGSFEGFTGIVDSLDMEAQTADVRVSMFGRETTVSLPLTQIKAEG